MDIFNAIIYHIYGMNHIHKSLSRSLTPMQQTFSHLGDSSLHSLNGGEEWGLMEDIQLVNTGSILQQIQSYRL